MANRYWVGGTAAWDGTAGTKWALTSGGAGGQAVPTSADDVFFSSLSTGTCTISTGNTGAKSINCTGFTGTLAGTANITVSGSVTLVAGMTYTYTGILTIAATSTLTSGGKTLGQITFNASGGTLTLGSACTLGITNSFALEGGTLDLNGFTLSTGRFLSTSVSGTRAITFGSANIALTSTTASAFVLLIQYGTNFSWTGTGSFTRNQAATANIDVFGSGGGTVSNAVNLTVNAGASTLTFTTTGWFKNLVFTGSTCTVSATVNIAGNLTLASGGTYTSVVPTFLASGTVTSAGRTLGNTTVNGSGITVTLADAMTVATGSTFTLTAGTLDLAGFTLSAGIFSSSNSNTRSITFGSANIALTSTTASTTVLSMATATGFTMTTSGGGFTRNMAATATFTFGTTGGTVSNAPNMSFTAGSSQISITINSWFKNLNFTGNTSSTAGSGTLNIAGDLTLAASGFYGPLIPTFRASGTITSNGATLGGNITINGAGITITLAGALTSGGLSFNLTQGALDLANNTLTVGTFVSNTSNTRSISFGSGNIVCTNTTPGIAIVSMATATNFTYTGTGGFRRNSTTTSSVVFGTSAGATASNAPNFTATGGTSAITLTGSHLKNVNLSAMTGGTGTGAAVNIYGNLTLGGGHSFTSLEPTFRASGTFTASGSTCGFVTINGAGITVTLGSAASVSSGGALTLTEGTFTTANFNVTAGLFSSSNSNTRTLNMGSGTWTISGSGATAWDTATTTGLTVVPSTSTITMTSASAKTFAGGGLTYYNLNQGGAGTLTISGSNTFNNITNSTQPTTVTFTAGTTQTVSAFGLSGTAGNLVTINSATPGSQFTLSDASGTINAQYLSIQDSNATGGAVWNSLLTNGNVNAGNNTGWIFAPPGNMFLMFI